jgi:hypothetical protein
MPSRTLLRVECLESREMPSAGVSFGAPPLTAAKTGAPSANHTWAQHAVITARFDVDQSGTDGSKPGGVGDG